MTPRALVCCFGFHLVRFLSLIQHLVTQQKWGKEMTESIFWSSGGTVTSCEFDVWVKLQPKYALHV